MASLVSTLTLDDAATSEQTGTVGEPTVATSGLRILVTGNWFTSRSTDGGRNWQFTDPFTTLPPASGGFCCDQVVHYCRSRRLWVWLLQYVRAGAGNVVRLAVSSSGSPGTWTWWDLAPADIDPAWDGLWFDYPDLAESEQNLWLSLNAFDGGDRWRRAIVLRFPLDDLVARGELTRRSWSTTDVGSLRFVRGAEEQMWFAGHGAGGDSLALFAWPDGDEAVSAWEVPVAPWNDAGYTSLGPGGAEWLARADDRITGAWRSGGRLGFAWTAAADADRPHPFVRVARVDEGTLELVDEPDLWSQQGAYAYPATSPNSRGDVGIAAFFGGPTHPALVVGNLEESGPGWRVCTVATSTHPPGQGKWGDYLTVCPDPRRLTYWVASGYTLQGGTDRRNVEPLVVTFAP